MQIQDSGMYTMTTTGFSGGGGGNSLASSNRPGPRPLQVRQPSGLLQFYTSCCNPVVHPDTVRPGFSNPNIIFLYPDSVQKKTVGVFTILIKTWLRYISTGTRICDGEQHKPRRRLIPYWIGGILLVNLVGTGTVDNSLYYRRRRIRLKKKYYFVFALVSSWMDTCKSCTPS